jgi:hypothetical protein
MLVQNMYAAVPDLSACSQKMLLQLLLLADSYGVPKVLAAAAAEFACIAAKNLHWDVVQALQELPAGCADLETCKGLFETAQQKLQYELGDLELVWADSEKQQLLLELPQPLLLQLLSDPTTRVTSENTVFYTIERWWQHHSRAYSLRSLKEITPLVRLIRMQVC